MPGHNKIFFDGRFPGDDLTSEMLNWKDAVISEGQMKEKMFLPNDYIENNNPRSDNGVFPNTREYVVTGRGTLVALELSADCKNDGKSLFMRAESYLKMTVYPNLEPFKLWESLTIKTEDDNKSFNLQVHNKEGRELLNINNTVDNNNLASWDLSDLFIGLEEVDFTIRALDNNTEITLIEMIFDITADTVDIPLTPRLMPVNVIPESAFVGTIDFKLTSDLTSEQITQASNIYNNYNINGETLFLENFPFNSSNIPLRADYKNIGFLDSDNHRVKHYLLNCQNKLGFYIELPPNKLATSDINLKAVIYNRDTVIESATSIFSYIADSRNGRPFSNISKVDYPSVANRQPTSIVLNNEEVITTGSYGSEGFRVGNFDYQELNYLVDYSEATGDTGNLVSFYRDSNIENQSINENNLVFDWNNSAFGLYGGTKATVAGKIPGMHMEALRSPNNTKAYYLHDRLARPNYALPMNGFSKNGEFLVFRSEKGLIKIPWVVSMQNPCSTLFNTRFEDKDYNYVPK